MSDTPQRLFAFLQDLLYEPQSAKLDVDALDEDYRLIGQGLLFFAEKLKEMRFLALMLSKGDLSIEHIPKDNELAAPLKALHASLRHLSWQSQQVAQGDYQQRIDFMGDFSEAFNSMIEQLDTRQRALEEEVRLSHEKTEALEQSNDLLTALAHAIAQPILVLSDDFRKVLFLNRAAQYEITRSERFLQQLTAFLRVYSHKVEDEAMEYQYDAPEGERYFAVRAYRILWDDENALALALNDVSDARRQRLELENFAYRDTLTKLYNRFYGMRTLDEWMEQKRPFVLSFADLDNLKYVNDTYGHSEGDEYIISAARHLSLFSQESVVCRLGGDEFFILTPDLKLREVKERMEEIRAEMRAELVQKNKPYYCNISYGCVSVCENNHLPSNELLGLADERMYENKRKNKRIRMMAARGEANGV